MALFGEKIRDYSALNTSDKAVLKDSIDSILNGTYEPGSDVILIYLGNGAKGYKDGMSPHLFKLSGVGKYSHMAGYKAENLNGLPLQDIFVHSQGSLIGYTLRKMELGKWRWLTTKNVWRAASEDSERRVFTPGSTLREIEVEPGDVILAEAVWMNQKEEILEFGYKFFGNRLLARSMGGYWGKTRLNTKLALHNSIQNNYKFVEADLRLTTDKKLVCSYGWSEKACAVTGMEYKPEFKNMTHELFMKQDIDGMALMDGPVLLRHMINYPYLMLAINIGGGDPNKKEDLIQAIVNTFKHDEAMLHRIIIIVDSPEEYFIIRKFFPFKYFLYNIGQKYNKVDEAIAFCMSEGICSICLNEFIAVPSTVKKIRNAGLYAVAETVNGANAARRLHRTGVSTVVTNFLSPARLDEPEIGVRVVYNGSEGAEEHYSEYLNLGLLPPSSFVKQTAKGSFEYIALHAVSQHNPYKLVCLQFTKEGYVFDGWKARSKTLKDTWHWLCTDGKWRGRKTIENNERFKYMVFTDRDTIPFELFPPSNRIVLVAQWITEEEYQEKLEKKQKKEKVFELDEPDNKDTEKK